MLHLLMHVCLRAFTISRVANNSIKRIEVGKSANLPEMAEYMRLSVGKQLHPFHTECNTELR